jgi:VCBS repeat-containing protein
LDDVRLYNRALSAGEVSAIASGVTTLTSIDEDNTNSAGNAIAQIIADGAITDVDYTPNSSAPEAIAITAVDNTNGAWQYKLGGGAWVNIDSAQLATKALLLDGADSVRFIPNADWNGDATFTYRAWDKTGGTNAGSYVTVSAVGDSSPYSVGIATVTIAVQSVEDAPIGVADVAIAVEAAGGGLSGINPSGNILANDTDGDVGDTKTIIGIAAGNLPNTAGNVGSSVIGNYGSILISSNGEYTYTVDSNHPTVRALRSASETLSDVFSYTVRDAGGLTGTTQITITIQGANKRPIAMGESYQTNFLTPFTMRLSDLLANDTDAEGDALRIQILALPCRGTVVMDGNGGMTYRPETNFVGTVTLVYAVSDGSLGSDPQTVQIAISMPPTTVVSLSENRGGAAFTRIDAINVSSAVASTNLSESTTIAMPGVSSVSGDANSASSQSLSGNQSAAGSANIVGSANAVGGGSLGGQIVPANAAEPRGGAMDWGVRNRLETIVEDTDLAFDLASYHLNWITESKISELAVIQRLHLDPWGRVGLEPD